MCNHAIVVAVRPTRPSTNEKSVGIVTPRQPLGFHYTGNGAFANVFATFGYVIGVKCATLRDVLVVQQAAGCVDQRTARPDQPRGRPQNSMLQSDMARNIAR